MRSGVRFIIQTILYKEQIKHLRKKDLWPKEFDNVNEDDHELVEDEEEAEKKDDEEDEDEDDGIVYDQGYDNDEDLMMNTNHATVAKLEDSSEDESDPE